MATFWVFSSNLVTIPNNVMSFSRTPIYMYKLLALHSICDYAHVNSLMILYTCSSLVYIHV